MRHFYSLLFYLALPFILLRLLWRSLRQPEYRLHIHQRLGYTNVHLQTSIWLHAVSVGEVLAAIPLIKLLQKKYPTIPIVVTTMTPTGAARLKNALGDSVIHTYIPYDVPTFVQRFLKRINPQIAIIMETELWPNLLAQCHRKQIPIYLINARLSAKSARGYEKINGLTRQMLQQLKLIAAHGEKDAQRFIKLGANPEKVIVTGNIKFDLELPQDLQMKATNLRNQLGDKRFIWIAASTHEGEEEIVLKAHDQLRTVAKDALLILVPRHPNRFDTIYKLCEQQFITKRRSGSEAVTDDTAVYLGDTMGELLSLYSAADVAFVAGSLIPRGGHNMLEPGALGKAILTGPHLFNFAEISELFIAAASLTKVQNADELAQELIKLFSQPQERDAMGARALQVVKANRGALTKQFELINESLSAG